MPKAHFGDVFSALTELSSVAINIEEPARHEVIETKLECRFERPILLNEVQALEVWRDMSHAAKEPVIE
jgi:hypothetical protein